MPYYVPTEIHHLKLDKDSVFVRRILSPAYMRSSNLEWSQERDFVTQEMLLELRYWFAKKDTITTTQRPRTWWDAFKHAYQNRW